MEKDFVKYEEALALKELGFDEPCFGMFNNMKFHKTQKFDLCEANRGLVKSSEFNTFIASPETGVSDNKQ